MLTVQALMWGVLLLGGSTVHAQAASVVYDLEACVQRALEIHPGVQAAGVDVEIASSQLDQVRAARFLPKFDWTWVVGPSPEARGNALVGDTNLNSLSVFTFTEATLIQPVYTFGKFRFGQQAAAAGVKVKEAGVLKARQDLEFQVAEIYFGLLLANELVDLALEAREEIQKARAFIDEKLEADEGDFTYTDLARIDRFVYDVEEKVHKAEKGQALARSAMRLLLGLGDRDSVALSETLAPVAFEAEPLEAYVDRRKNRPEMEQLRSGMEATAALAKVAKTDYYPQFFIGAQFKWSYAPNRDDQKSPFANDNFNFVQGGAILGFRQSLSFGMTSARVKKAQLEAEKLRYLHRLADKGFGLEIEEVYRDLLEAKANIAAAQKARRATRRWFFSARDGFNSGLGEAKEMIDAVKEYSIIRAKYHAEVYHFNRAWARLQKVTGHSLVP
ncbi:MAG: TolC family protein [bacterium]|nr:TolC family protein [bacterium]